MKHTAKITLILIGLFILSQCIGLFIFHNYLDKTTGNPNQKSPFGNEIPVAPADGFNWGLIIGMSIAILIGTALALFLMRKEEIRWMKLWIGIAIFANLFVAFGGLMWHWVAGLIALALTYWRIKYPSVWIQNSTELFLYGGFAVIFAFALNIWTVIAFLVLISIYDAWAVWKSKHMIKLAKMVDYNIFAGFWINYKNGAKAILGGGDIAFSLMSSCVALRIWGLLPAVVTIIITTIALSLLLFISQKGKFYPAMPFISCGVFVGYLISWGLLI